MACPLDCLRQNLMPNTGCSSRQLPRKRGPCELKARCDLKDEIGAECSLIGDEWVVRGFDRPITIAVFFNMQPRASGLDVWHCRFPVPTK